MTQVFAVGDKVTFTHHGQILEGTIEGRTFVGPSANDFVYIVEVDGWIGPFTLGAHQITSSTNAAFDRAMRGV